MAGELGMDLRLAHIPGASQITVSQILYSESCGRFILTVTPDKKDRFEEIFCGMEIGQIGVVTESPRFSIKDSNDTDIIEEDQGVLKDCWKRRFGELI